MCTIKFNTIKANRNYYYFTNKLKHNNKNFVNLPLNVDKTAFKTIYDIIYGGVLFLIKSGDYQIIYTDQYKISVSSNVEFQFWDLTNDKKIFSTKFIPKTSFTPFTINSVINVQANTKVGLHSSPINSVLDGTGYSTFFIKYLGY